MVNCSKTSSITDPLTPFDTKIDIVSKATLCRDGEWKGASENDSHTPGFFRVSMFSFTWFLFLVLLCSMNLMMFEYWMTDSCISFLTLKHCYISSLHQGYWYIFKTRLSPHILLPWFILPTNFLWKVNNNWNKTKT